MPIRFDVTDRNAYARLEGASAATLDRFAELLKPVEDAVLNDARSRAVAHFHSIGAKPGLYLAGFRGGVKRKPTAVIGWVRNGNQLAHLLENGFTISAILIAVKNAGSVMEFAGGCVELLYREYVHRPQTKVQAYPAIKPALEAHRADVRDAAERAAS